MLSKLICNADKIYWVGSKLQFDYTDIRPKGARLVTSGGKAPGPQPLKECLVKIEGILKEFTFAG